MIRVLLWSLPVVVIGIFFFLQPEDRSKGSAYYKQQEAKRQADYLAQKRSETDDLERAMARHFQPVLDAINELKRLGFLAQLDAKDEEAVRRFIDVEDRPEETLPYDGQNATYFWELMLTADTPRILVYTRDHYEYHGADSKPHTAMLKRLAEISRGKFAPQNIVEEANIERYLPGDVVMYRGSVKVSFKYDGKDFSYATTDVDRPVVRSAFLKTLNAALGTEHRFATTAELDRRGKGLVALVSDAERKALSAASGLNFEYPE